MEATKVYPKKRMSWLGRLATVQEVNNGTVVIILDEPERGQSQFTVSVDALEELQDGDSGFIEKDTKISDERWADLTDKRRAIWAGRRDGEVHILRGHPYKGTVSSHCNLRLDCPAEVLVFLQRPEDITCRQCILGFLDDVNVSPLEDKVAEGRWAQGQMEAISALREIVDGSMCVE